MICKAESVRIEKKCNEEFEGLMKKYLSLNSSQVNADHMEN